MVLKYKGTCELCGAALAAGTEANVCKFGDSWLVVCCGHGIGGGRRLVAFFDSMFAHNAAVFGDGDDDACPIDVDRDLLAVAFDPRAIARGVFLGSRELRGVYDEPDLAGKTTPLTVVDDGYAWIECAECGNTVKFGPRPGNGVCPACNRRYHAESTEARCMA